MFEIFLFVNPIGIHCYDAEMAIKGAIDELGVESCFRFIPITNAKVIKEDIIRRKTIGQTVNDIPQYTMASYQALRNYHAIKFEYGNKKARSYLVNLQKAISADFNVYSQDLPEQVAQDLGLNFQRIIDPRISKYIDDSTEQDKELAQKFNVQNIPTTVIFNENNNYGILLEGLISQDKLVKIFQNNKCLHLFEPEKAEEKNYFEANHLRLM